MIDLIKKSYYFHLFYQNLSRILTYLIKYRVQKKNDESEVDKGEWNISIYGKDDSTINKLGEKIIVGNTNDYKF